MYDIFLAPFLPQAPAMIWAFLVLAAYLAGSIPFGLFIGKIAGVGDIRTRGSGNIGATNMLRVGGKKLAAVTLLFDGLKGALPVLLAMHMMPQAAPLCGLVAAAAHMFPAWLNFKGGKGVASFLGVMLALSFPAGFITVIAWIVFAFVFRYSSLAALAASAIAPFILYFVTGMNIAPVLALAALVWIRHRANIARLLNKTEPKIGERA